MKKILATVASIAMVAACSTAAFAAGDIGKSETVTPGASSGNTNTGVVLTVCLLYTSPSPRDRQKSRMPSSA